MALTRSVFCVLIVVIWYLFHYTGGRLTWSLSQVHWQPIVTVWALQLLSLTQWRLILLLQHLCTSTLTIESTDQAYYMFLEWLRRHEFPQQSRHLNVRCVWLELWHHNYSQRHKVQYDLSNGLHLLQHSGRFYFVHRETRQSPTSNTGDNVQLITIYTLLTSTNKLRGFVEGAFQEVESNKAEKFTFRRAVVTSTGNACWSQPMSEPKRPIDSVILGPDVKERITRDMGRHLHPNTSKWYARVGKPDRRGYLFVGQSGTGKTSLLKVLAGMYHLDLCCINATSRHLRDEGLEELFHSLPPKCIVCFEDIDKANIYDGSNRHTHDTNSYGITLGGLLNAIDGVEGSGGRILVMTSNGQKELSKALTRPGRIDLQLEFNVTTERQRFEHFMWYYWGSKQLDAGESRDVKIHLERQAEIFASSWEDPPTSAKIQEHLAVHVDDPDAAVKSIRR